LSKIQTATGMTLPDLSGSKLPDRLSHIDVLGLSEFGIWFACSKSRESKYRQVDGELERAFMKLLENPLGIHEQALALRNKRMELIAANIANADTPRFRARDLDFQKILAGANPSPMAVTDSRHFDTGEVEAAGGIVFRTPYNSAVDGNTVEINVEQAKYGEAATQYQATLQFLESRIAGIRKSLRGD
jgi:flagellar basal-body rod protein FlgB